MFSMTLSTSGAKSGIFILQEINFLQYSLKHSPHAAEHLQNPPPIYLGKNVNIDKYYRQKSAKFIKNYPGKNATKLPVTDHLNSAIKSTGR